MPITQLSSNLNGPISFVICYTENIIVKLWQLRFAGDLLMELGAGLELATSTVPHLFLPLACMANVAKVIILCVFFSSSFLIRTATGNLSTSFL